MPVEGFELLAELALDMRWSRNHYADEVWRQLHPKLWETTENPWVILQTVSRDQMERVLADPDFRKKVDALSSTSGGAGTHVVSAKLSAGSSDQGCLLQYGIHGERSPSDLFRRSWQCGRRSAQSSQRSGCAGDRYRTALPARLFSPGDR